MNRFSSIFSQLLQLFPRMEFHRLVKETQAERHARGFTCWGQFVAMLFCQLGRAHSLRESCCRSSHKSTIADGITDGPDKIVFHPSPGRAACDIHVRFPSHSDRNRRLLRQRSTQIVARWIFATT